MFFWEELKNQITLKLEEKELSFTYPPDLSWGDLSLACFVPAKKNGLDPLKQASLWANTLQADSLIGSYFSKIEAVGPYVNFSLKIDILAKKVLAEIGDAKEKYGYHNLAEKERIMLEYSNGNTHKEYHVGHLRNISFGDSMSNILEANGYEVIRVSYINDFGIHTAKTIWNWKNNPEYANRKEPKGFLLGQCYMQANQKLSERPEYKIEVAKIMHEIESRIGENYDLWKESRTWSIEYFASIYKELGIKFAKIFYESEVIDEGLEMVNTLLKKGILKESEGAIIADLEADGLGVLPIVRSDKTALYPVADLALAVNKFSLYDLKASYYVVDIRQSLYFKQLFRVLELLGYKQTLVHLPYDFVTLPEGMMSSRSGNVITYRDLKDKIKNELEKETRIRHENWKAKKIAQVAKDLTIAIIKFEMLKVSADKEIVFNIEEALRFDGYTACYLEYSHARLCSIIKKENAFYFTGKTDFSLLTEQKEKELVIKLAKYPEVLALAGEKKNPSEIARYIFELAQISNDYYHAVNILKAEKKIKKARLVLIKGVVTTLRSGFKILGLPILKEM